MIFPEAFIPMSTIRAWEVVHPMKPLDIIARWTHIPADRIEAFELEGDVNRCGFIIRRLRVKP
jgi:hypothetical protein